MSTEMTMNKLRNSRKVNIYCITLLSFNIFMWVFVRHSTLFFNMYVVRSVLSLKWKQQQQQQH